MRSHFSTGKRENNVCRGNTGQRKILKKPLPADATSFPCRTRTNDPPFLAGIGGIRAAPRRGSERERPVPEEWIFSRVPEETPFRDRFSHRACCGKTETGPDAAAHSIQIDPPLEIFYGTAGESTHPAEKRKDNRTVPAKTARRDRKGFFPDITAYFFPWENIRTKAGRYSMFQREAFATRRQ